MEGRALMELGDVLLSAPTIRLLVISLHSRAFREAATALVHGMTVVTRNVPDFAPTGVALVNPWDPRTSR